MSQSDGVGGSLEIQSLLFEGAPTRIFRARASDGRQVIVKSAADDAGLASANAGIQHEYDIARGLQTEHVVTVYGIERGAGSLSLVLEDFGGISLDQVVEQRRLSVEEVLEIGIQVAAGLAEIHGANIIHKDINPSNIVYNQDTRVAKIIDFGISSYLTREQADMGSPSMLEGSLPYLSPEQTGRMNRALDYRTDFYSLGATLYELLAGRRLFDVEEPIEWLHCHIARSPVPLHRIDPDVPPLVSDIVAKLLAKAADERYLSAVGIRSDLEACLTALRAGTVPAFTLGRQDLPNRFQIRQRLYGREEQIRRLMADFDRAGRGAAGLVLVSGYSGIGKTCLVKELYRPITARRGFFISGKFDQLHRNVPFSALVTALRDLVRLLLTEPEQKLERWRSRILEALEGNGRLLAELIPDLALVLGKQPPLPELPGQAAELRFRRTLVNFVRLFCRPEHPLVLFLDDLQWADSATLALLEMLLTESSLQHLLIIGAYRDNEVHAGHPLTLAMQRVRERLDVDELLLPPLSRQDLAALLADALYADVTEVADLAGLVEQKTAGNPFFTEEFLKDLYHRGLIRFDSATAQWSWDLAGIAAEEMTDNVVDLMSEKLQRLSSAAQRTLQVAACIGHRLELDMLLAVSGGGWGALAPALREVMSQGLIAPIGNGCQIFNLDHSPRGNVELAFAHDRIQQAAHELLDVEARNATHLRIGRMLLERLDADARDEHLYQITDHLNTACGLMNDPAERHELVRLNQAAGQRALLAAAYTAAFEYFTTAIRLLEDGCWTGQRADTLKLHVQAANAGCQSGRYPECDAILAAALEQVTDPLEAVPLNEVRLASLVGQGLHTPALELGKALMAELGIRHPSNPRLQMLLYYFLVQRKLKGMSLADLRALPESDNAALSHTYDLGKYTAAAAHFAQPELLGLMTLRGVYGALEHGVSERAIHSIGGLGVQLCIAYDKVEQGEKFSRFALELCDRYPKSAARSRVQLSHAAYVAPWNEPLKDIVDSFARVYEVCVEDGDFDGAAQALTYRQNFALWSGMPLEEVEESFRIWRSALVALNQPEGLAFFDAAHQLVLNLMGQADDPAQLKGARYDVDLMLPEHRRMRATRLIISTAARQALLQQTFGEARQALAHLDGIRDHVRQFQNIFDGMYILFNEALISLSVAREERGAERRRLLRLVKRNRRQVDRWVARIPANVLARSQLLTAEWHRTRGDERRAQRYYDLAIHEARAQGLCQEEGQANRLAGEMHLEAGRTTIAEAYLGKARNAYERWGAQGVVRHLEAKYPVLFRRSAPRRRSRTPGTTTGETMLHGLDITALMKALKAIAEERVHSRMVSTIITAAIEFAGAQRGLLLLRNDSGELRIEAESSVDDSEPSILQSVPVADSESLSHSVVNYVTRTGESVVIHDAQEPQGPVPGLNLELYVRTNQIASILCLPIIASGEKHAELIGVLYLENNRASYTFTEERFDTLEIIGVAAAGRLELSRKAAVDGLTGLFNRDYFQTMLHQEFLASRRHDRPLSLILADIDHFKRFNDTWGHQVGDQVLQAVAAAIRGTCRETDIVARFGGEELAVILPDTGAAGAEALAERIRAAVETLQVDHGGESLVVTLSLGVATAGIHMADEHSLVGEADAALYRAKHEGRNRVGIAA